MNFFILFLALLSASIACAQSPTDVLFTKYGNKTGVSVSTDIASVPEDSTTKVPLTMTVKIMAVENEDEEKGLSRLIRQIVRDCGKILDGKDYAVIAADKDDLSSVRVYRYQNETLTELCELEEEAGRMTLTVTQITGMTKEGKENFKVKKALN